MYGHNAGKPVSLSMVVLSIIGIGMVPSIIYVWYEVPFVSKRFLSRIHLRTSDVGTGIDVNFSRIEVILLCRRLFYFLYVLHRHMFCVDVFLSRHLFCFSVFA